MIARLIVPRFAAAAAAKITSSLASLRRPHRDGRHEARNKQKSGTLVGPTFRAAGLVQHLSQRKQRRYQPALHRIVHLHTMPCHPPEPTGFRGFSDSQGSRRLTNLPLWATVIPCSCRLHGTSMLPNTIAADVHTFVSKLENIYPLYLGT